jgi:putative endonuclease
MSSTEDGVRRPWFVYLCNRGGRLYTGITIDLANRMRQHQAELLWTEEHDGAKSAAKREKEIKGWTRAKKLGLIGRGQPE